MSGVPEEPAESVSDRSALPRIPGLPWWGAVLLAVTATAVGFAYDAGAGNKELGAVFATFFVLGCVLAVLAVRQASVFTAVIQPPLILFVAVPTAYFLFHGGQLGGIKDILINCGYPLIERFPLMFFTSAAVLLIGMGRWYLDRSGGHTDIAATTAKAAKVPAALMALLARPFAKEPADGEQERPARRPRRSAPSRASSTRRRTDPSRARHNRPPESDIAASAAAADRRERAAARQRPRRPRRDGEPPMPPPDQARQPRRPRPSARDPREPWDPRPPRRTPPPPRGGYDGPDPYERPRRRPAPDPYDRYPDYPGYDPRPDDRPRRGPAGDGSHHPISRVRYRGSDEERRTEHRSRPRAAHRRDAEYWESDL